MLLSILNFSSIILVRIVIFKIIVDDLIVSIVRIVSCRLIIIGNSIV